MQRRPVRFVWMSLLDQLPVPCLKNSAFRTSWEQSIYRSLRYPYTPFSQEHTELLK